MAFRIAESYRLLERYESANEWLDVCVELKYFDVNPDIYFFKGEIEKNDQVILVKQ